MFLPSSQVIHLSKEIWGPDASEFVPERWFGPDIERQSKCFMPVSSLFFSLHGSRHHTCPPEMCVFHVTHQTNKNVRQMLTIWVFVFRPMQWGLGWGSCPAQSLAKVQIYKTVAT